MRGFTLIELTVSIAILGSLLALGIPKMNDLIERYESQTVFYSLRKTLTHARGLAQDKSLQVSVCPISNQQCSDDWSRDIAVFNDQNTNNTIDDDEDIYFYTNIGSQYGAWLKSKSRQNYVRFNESGHAFSSATTFLYCPHSNNNHMAKSIVISFQGRIRTTSYLNNQGAPYARFSNLNCR